MTDNNLLPFREGLFELDGKGKGFLLANICLRCGITNFPKRDFCVQCDQSDRIENIQLGDRGILHSYTVVFRAPPDFPTPYIVGYVDLEGNGIRIFSPITGCRPEDLVIGMEMVLVFGPGPRKMRSDKYHSPITYQFRPVDSPSLDNKRNSL